MGTSKVKENVKKSKTDKTLVQKPVQKTDLNYIGTVQVSQFNHDKKLYVNLYLWLFTNVIKDYKYRKKIIGFIFEDGTLVKMKVRTAIVNLIMWKPYCDFDKTLTIECLFDTKYVSDSTISNRMDDIIAEFKSFGVAVEDLCKCIRHMIESLASISKNFCIKIGNTINMRDIIDLANRNPQFDSILHTSYDENNMPSINFIEKDINEKNVIMSEIIKNDVQSSIRPFLNAGGNVNMGQMAQCLVSIGPRSDIYGNISPVIVNTNFVMGLRNTSDYYLESFSQRKALIANKYQMCDSGYTSRQVDLLTVDSSLEDIDDCGTKNTLGVYVTDESTLNMLEFKYMVTGVDKKGKQTLVEISPKNMKNLIGQTIQVRSHTKCACVDGAYCKTCYGGLSYVTLGYHTNLLASKAFTEPVSQTVLSTKHLNKTNTKVIKWCDKICTFFKTESEGLYLKPVFCTKDVEIGFYIEDIEEYLNILTDRSMDEEDEDSEEAPSSNDVMLDYVTRFMIQVKDQPPIAFDKIDVDLYINAEFLQKVLKSTKIIDGIIYVNLHKQSPDSAIFDVNIENIEISAYLKRIMALIGVKSKIEYTTIEDILQRLSTAINEIGVRINFAHLESIVFNMIRDPDFLIGRPDFTKENTAYTIIPANRAIIMSPSLTTSLAFERIGQQMRDVYTYIKHRKGFLDPFFE